jgi:hypothetical protein
MIQAGVSPVTRLSTERATAIPNAAQRQEAAMTSANNVDVNSFGAPTGAE